jgi:hypothetical protein
MTVLKRIQLPIGSLTTHPKVAHTRFVMLGHYEFKQREIFPIALWNLSATSLTTTWDKCSALVDIAITIASLLPQ